MTVTLSVDRLDSFIKHLKEVPIEFLDMCNPSAPRKGSCGCFAWAGYLALNEMKIPIGYSTKYRDHRFSNKEYPRQGEYLFHKEMHRLSRYLFSDGEERLVEFTSVPYLASWAKQNPDLWGNDQGKHVFTRATAFGEDMGSGIAKEKVVNHLTEVWERLLLNENTLLLNVEI